MRERWLFLLLCAFLAQLSSSDYAVGNDGSRFDTMLPDPSTEQTFYGDEPVNGSEFASGRAKIRRARSVDDDFKKAEEALKNADYQERRAEEEVQKAKDKQKLAEDAKTKARELDEAAQAKIDKITNEDLKTAMDEWRTVNTTLAKAQTTMNEANSNYERAETYEKNNITAFTNATNNFTSLKPEKERLENNEKAKKSDFEAKKKVESTARTSQESSESDAAYSTGKWLKAEEKLGKLNNELTTLKGTLAGSIKNSQENDAKIELRKEYQNILTDKSSENSKKTGLENSISPINTEKTRLVLEKKKMEENVILQGQDTFLDWKTITVVDAIADWKKKAENFKNEYEKMRNASASAADLKNKQVQQIDAEDRAKGLEEIKSFKFRETVVQVILNERDKLMKNIADQITAEDNKISGIKSQITEIDKAIGILDGKITALVAKAKRTIDQIESDYNMALRADQDLKDEVKNDRETVNNKQQSVDKETNITSTLKLDSSAKNETLKLANEALEKATKEKGYAQGNFTEAERKLSEFMTNEYKEADDLVKSTNKEKEQATKIRQRLYREVSSAISVLDLEVKAQDAAREKVAKIEDFKRKAEKEKVVTKDAAYDAMTALDNANNEVTRLESIAKEKKDLKVEAEKLKMEADKAVKAEAQKQEEKKQMIATLTTGLGSAIGILIFLVVGGVLVFFLIKRKKKAAKKKEKKEPKVEYIDSEDGLTILRREGQPDRKVVKGEDINIKGDIKIHGPKKPSDYKHKMAGDVGVDHVEKLVFDKNQYAGYFLEENRPEAEDSVEISEGKGNLSIMDRYGEQDAAPPDSQRYKPEEDKKSSKSKRANEPNAKNPPSSSDEQDKKKK